MKKKIAGIAVLLCILALAACESTPIRPPMETGITDRTAAVSEILEISRSTTEITQPVKETEPPETEVVATAATTLSTTARPPETETPKEYFTVKFVDDDGYTSLSLQTVAEGADAIAPTVLPSKDGKAFRGWDKDFTNVHNSMIVRAIYQKEYLTVNFYDIDRTLLKTVQVRYGEDAEPPEVPDRPGFLFDGWNILFSEVKEDLNVFATYYPVKTTEGISLVAAQDILLLSKTGEFEGVASADAPVYGNFTETFTTNGGQITTLSGALQLSEELPLNGANYTLRLTVRADSGTVLARTLTQPGTTEIFSVNFSGAETVSITLETLVDGEPAADAATIGGLVRTAFYGN